MDRDTIIIIIEAAILAAALVFAFVAFRRRRLRAKGVKVSNLLNEYFQDGMTADELGRRMKKIADRRFWGAPAFFGLTVSAFQGAVDARRARRALSEEDERKLMSMLAAAKREFGLTDRYQIEGWRAGRE
jgi:hypothetical protein